MNLFNAVNIHGRAGPHVVAAANKDVTAQLQYFENFPLHEGAVSFSASQGTLSVHAVNIPLSISFNYPTILHTILCNDATRSGTFSLSIGLYSLSGSTLSLANSASNTRSWSGSSTSTLWMSLITSATQNITPGPWYFGVVASVSTNAGASNNEAYLYANTAINPANAIPGGFLMGRLTASTGAMPASIATSDLDITGNDATRQPYLIITA